MVFLGKKLIGKNLTAVVLGVFLIGCSNGEFSANSANSSKKPANNANGKPAEGGHVNSPTTSGTGTEQPNSSSTATSESTIAITSNNGCIDLPAGSDVFSSTLSGGATKNSIFHRVVAVDPGHTGGFDPVRGTTDIIPLSPDTEMATNEFTLSSAAIANIIKQGVTEIEYMAFAHQGKNGLDKISLALHTKSDDLSDVLIPNRYSAYAYVSVKNLKVVAEKPIGDVDLFSFSYNPAATDPLNVSIRTSMLPHDGTGIVGPASKNTVAKVSKKGISLEDFKLVITINADMYDSVQYRAIRANLWAPNALTAIPSCK